MLVETLYTLLTRFAARGSIFFILLAVAYFLSPEEVGQYGLTITTGYALCYIFSLGLRHALAFFLANKNRSANDLVKSVVLYICVLLPFWSVLSYTIFRVIHSESNNSTVVYLSVLCFLPLVVNYILQGVFLGLDKISLFNKSEIFTKVVALLITLVFIALYKDLTLIGALLIFSSSSLLGLCYTVSLIFRCKSHFSDANTASFHEESHLKLFKRMMTYGIPLSVAISLSVLSPIICMYILKRYISLEAVGYFFLAYKITEIVSEAATSAGMVVFAKSINSKKIESSMVSSLYIGRLLFSFALVIFIIVFTFKGVMISLSSPKYSAEFIYLFIVITASLPFLSFSRVANSGFSAVGEVRRCMIIQFAGFVSNILICFALVENLGPQAGASSLLFSRFVVFILFVYMFSNFLGKSIFEILFRRIKIK